MNTEADNTFWLNDTSKHVFFNIFRMCFKDRLKGREELFYSLKEFCLVWITSFNSFE
jgi:hypothetical protein